MAEDTFHKITKLLVENKINFEHLTHEHVHSSKDAAKVRGTSIKQAAKAIVLKIKKRDNYYVFVQCVLCGHKKIDLKKLKQILNAKSAALASPEEVLDITNCTIGSVPPFGILFDIPVYADKFLFENQQIVFSAGTHNDSIKMSPSDWSLLVQPVVEEFSVVE